MGGLWPIALIQSASAGTVRHVAQPKRQHVGRLDRVDHLFGAALTLTLAPAVLVWVVCDGRHKPPAPPAPAFACPPSLPFWRCVPALPPCAHARNFVSSFSETAAARALSSTGQRIRLDCPSQQQAAC